MPMLRSYVGHLAGCVFVPRPPHVDGPDHLSYPAATIHRALGIHPSFWRWRKHPPKYGNLQPFTFLQAWLLLPSMSATPNGGSGMTPVRHLGTSMYYSRRPGTSMYYSRHLGMRSLQVTSLCV